MPGPRRGRLRWTRGGLDFDDTWLSLQERSPLRNGVRADRTPNALEMPKSRAHFLSRLRFLASSPPSSRVSVATLKASEASALPRQSCRRLSDLRTFISPPRRQERQVRQENLFSYATSRRRAHWHPAVGAENQRLLAFCEVPAALEQTNQLRLSSEIQIKIHRKGGRAGRGLSGLPRTPRSRDAKSANFFFEFEVAIDLLAALSSVLAERNRQRRTIGPFRPSDLL